MQAFLLMVWSFMKDSAPKNWKQVLFGLLMLGTTFVATRCGILPPDAPLPPLPDPIFEPGNMGWVRDDEEVKVAMGRLDFKIFADTPAGKSDDPIPKSVYLWQNYEKLMGKKWPARNQANIGSCVANGTNTAIEMTLATQIVFQKGGADEFKHVSVEVTYGGSRVQIGKGRIRGDGSVCSWAADYVKQEGVVSMEKHPSHDLSAYSVPRCREFGDKGVPEPLRAIAKDYPVRDYTFCKSWADVKKALASGYGIAMCSNAGFEGNRDANGVKKPRGSWAHCMALIAYHTEGAAEYCFIENSWGSRPNEGPTGWAGAPDSGFWVESSVIDRLAKQQGNEVIAFSGIKGFPSRKLDWFVQVEPRVDPGRQFAHREVLYASIP